MTRRVSSLGALLVGTVLAACSATGPATGAGPTAAASPTGLAASAVPSAVASLSAPAVPSPAPARSPSPQAAPVGQSGSLPHVNILYGTLTGAHAFTVIASDKDYYQQYGVDATVEYAESATAMAALVSGQTDFVVGGVVETIQAIASGSPLEVVAFNQDENPYGLFTQPGITTLGELKGKTVGIAARGDTSDISLRIALKGSGLNVDQDLTVEPVGNSPARYTALLTGQVDAAILDQQQFADQAKAQGLNLLVNLEEQRIPYAAGGLIVNTAFAKAHPDEVVDTIKALIDGSRFFNDPANKTEVLGYLASSLQRNADDPVVLQSYAVLTARPHMIPATPDGVDTIVQALLQIDPSRYASVSTSQVIDPSFMDGLVSSGFVPEQGA